MIDIKNAIRLIQNNKIDNVFYLKGEDQFLQSFFIQKICEAIFIDQKVFKELLTPNEISGKEILERILYTDLFNSKKLFILRDPQQLKGKASKDLLNYCIEPISNHFLVMINDNFMDNSAFSKSEILKKNIVNVSTPFVNELYKWARYFLKENSKNADSAVIEELIENYGDSIYNIKNEIDKLCLMCENEIITVEHLNIESSFGRSRRRWELISSIGRRDLQKSVILSKEIICNSDTMISLIYPLTVFFQELLYVKMNNGTFVKSNSYIPLSNSVKNNLSNYAKAYKIDEIKQSIRELKRIETRQKTSKSNDESDLIYFIHNAIG